MIVAAGPSWDAFVEALSAHLDMEQRLCAVLTEGSGIGWRDKTGPMLGELMDRAEALELWRPLAVPGPGGQGDDPLRAGRAR